MPTSTKTIIMSLCGLIIIGSAVYFAKPKQVVQVQPVQVTEKVVEAPIAPATQTSPSLVAAPTQDASNDQIIDYIVDGLTADEMNAARATISSSTPGSQIDLTIGTNF